jgi:RHS repeat-associated protein
MRFLVRRALAFFSLLAPLCALAAPMAWFADDASVYQADATSRIVLRSVPLSALAIAADPGGGAWVTTSTAVVRLDAQGASVLTVSLSSLGLTAPVRAAVDAKDSSAWLMSPGFLVHLSPQGQVLHSTPLPGDTHAQAVAVGLDQRVWALGKTWLIGVSATGVVTSHTKVSNDLGGPATSMGLDPLSPTVWVIREDSGGSARRIARVDVSASQPNVTSIDSTALAGVAADAFAGGAWTLPSGAINRYNAAGALIQSAALGTSLGAARGIAVDPSTSALWLAREQGVSVLTFDAAPVGNIATNSAVKLISLSPFRPTPALTLLAPPPVLLTNSRRPTILLAYGTDCYGVACQVPTSRLGAYTLGAQLGFTHVAALFTYDSAAQRASYTPGPLADGVYAFSATLADRFGQTSEPVTSTLTVDTVAPQLLELAPPNESRLAQAAITVSGRIGEPGVIQLGSSAVQGPSFSFPFTLAPGVNAPVLFLTDMAGNSTQVGLSYYYLTVAVASPADGATVQTASVDVSGSFTGPSDTQVSVNGVAATVSGTSYSVAMPLVVGANTLTVSATSGGVSSTKTVRVSRGASSPGVLAPSPIDKTVASILAHTTAFLYSGENPVQTGISFGVIEPRRAAVLRGKVLTRDGVALSGVTISVLNNPQFGQTLSRVDGMFDMVVNGGGWLTINYGKAGYLPLQRKVNTPWQDFALAPDVVMIALDSKVTAVDLAANAMQVAQGSPIIDADGTRTATVLFPAGTTATMTLADGTTRALASINVRATEYTVGPNGPKAMPGALPPTSGYTYAVELSVDEAVALGARDVRFSQALPVYVDNFLNFPVGGIVPAGWYDREKAAWIPSANGRVIRILSIQNNRANIDSNGDGTPDSATQLAALGVSEAELTQLGNLYTAGKTLWRVPVTHFTPWDCNWPYGPPADATTPKQPEPKLESDDKVDEPECVGGSIIECQNRVLGERIPVTGVPFSLNYRSDRAPGYKPATALKIPLSGGTIPASLLRIELEVRVAGRLFSLTFPAARNQTHLFEQWDGMDAYGRTLQGSQPATVSVGYVYPAVYQQPAQLEMSFGAVTGVPISGNRARQEITVWQETRAVIGGVNRPPANNQSFGSWTASILHQYDPTALTLYYGNGTQRSAHSASRVITTVAGNGINAFGGEGVPANSTSLRTVVAVATDDAGNLFISEAGSNRVRKVTADGLMRTVAGNGSYGFSGDGGPATAASFVAIQGIAVDARGNLFIVDRDNHRIRRVSPDGTINTVAGNGSSGLSGNGGPATEASLSRPTSLAIDADGSIFIADTYNQVIRKVAPNGTISTVAGNGIYGFGGDGGPATAASLRYPQSVAVDAHGNLFIAEEYRVRKVAPNGLISTVAGNGISQSSGDGGQATAAGISPGHVAIDSRGNIFVSDFGNSQIRRVAPDGIITLVVGNGSPGLPSNGDGGPATAARISRPTGLNVNSIGDLFAVDFIDNRVRKITSSLRRFDGAEHLVPSEDAGDVFHFDSTGRHLRTLDARTNAVVRAFTYNPDGLLVQITDGDANITTIEREAGGNARAIVSAYGKRTALSFDTNGYLASVANPANETTRMTYSADGMMTTFTDPKGNASVMQFDARGRLMRDENAAGGSWLLSRTDLVNGYEARLTSGQDRSTTYRVERLSTGDTRRTNIYPDATQTTTLVQSNGSTVATAADGSVTTTVDRADPRFGMQSPLTGSATVRMPSGLTMSTTVSRAVTLSNPGDLTSLVSETDTRTVNGKTATSAYTAALRQTTTTSPANRQSIVRTDAQGRPVFAQLANLAPVTYAYDARGRLSAVTQGSGADARVSRYAYGADGFVQRITDSLERDTVIQRDAAGRPTQTVLPGARTLGMSFDANGNASSITPPSKPAHSFAYTPVDLESQYSPPALDDVPDSATRFSYSLDKDLTQIARPDATTLTYGYDAAGRLSAITPSAGAGSAVSFAYTASTGQIASIATADASLALLYDGPLPRQETLSGTISATLARSYNADFRIAALSVNGNAVSKTYDADGLLTQSGALTIARDPGHGFASGSTLAGVTTSQSYNAFGELQSFSAAHAGASLFGYTLSYDKGGRITSKVETVTGQSTTWGYGYDAAGRLASVTQNGSVIATYGYDANGNRTQQGGATVASVDAQDRLLSHGNASYAYTANGSLKQRTQAGQSTNYAYDGFGNLKSVVFAGGGRIDYLVDGRQRRIGKKVNGNLVQGFVYQDQLRIAAEFDGLNNVIARFIYGDRPNVPEAMIKGGVTYRIVTDHLGSVRLVVDANTGAIAQRIDYDAWGNVTNDSNPEFQPFGYAGGVYEPSTGLVRFGARDYGAVTGRWTAKDPIRFAGGDANLYTYVGGNPVSFVDPLGLWIFQQSTGRLYSEGNNPSAVTLVGGGYSGAIGAQNNGALESIRNVGPIPLGNYSIGPQQTYVTNSGQELPGAMTLTPQAGTWPFGRDGFLIHGDNNQGNRSASQGCVILGPPIRNLIGNSSDRTLRVVP